MKKFSPGPGFEHRFFLLNQQQNRIKIQQIREFGARPTQTINEWVERRRKWDQHVTRMDAERLVKISRVNIPVERRSPRRPKRRWSDLIID